MNSTTSARYLTEVILTGSIFGLYKILENLWNRMIITVEKLGEGKRLIFSGEDTEYQSLSFAIEKYKTFVMLGLACLRYTINEYTYELYHDGNIFLWRLVLVKGGCIK